MKRRLVVVAWLGAVAGFAACSFDWDSYDPRLGEGGSGLATGGHAAGGATSGGGGAGASGDWCAIDSYTDDFDDGLTDLAWARTYDGGGCTAGEQAGELLIDLTGPGPCDCAYISARSYDLTGRAAALELASIDDQDEHTYAFFRIEKDSDRGIEFFWNNATLTARSETTSGFQTVHSAPYDANAHRYLRMREDAGTTYWEISGDGSTWSAFGSAANPVPPDGLDVVIGAGLDAGGNATGAASYDSYNLP